MPDFKSRLPRDLYTASQVRELDRIAIEQVPIPGIELMQRAAAETLALLLDRFPQARQVTIFAGTGNNGGDGYMIAVLAKQQGIKAEVIQVGDHRRLQADALLANNYAQKAGIPIRGFDPDFHQTADLISTNAVIVDAILGTGLDRDVSPDIARAIDYVNSTGLPVVAVDVPSGICSDTGCIRGTAVRARHTVTFIGMKRGLLTGAAVDNCGIIHFSALDVPEKIYGSTASPRPDCQRIDMQQMSRKLLPRSPSSHKGDFGHTVVIGGDYGFGGAVSMAGEAALYSGSGLVSVITRPEHRAPILTRRPELMVHGTNDLDEQVESLLTRASVVVIGPGLGQSSWSRELLQATMAAQRARNLPLVMDADALNLLSEDESVSTRMRRDNWILTPHPGEAARLLGCETAELQRDRFASVARLQEKYGGVCLLKGAGSLICFQSSEGRQTELCSEGNAGMASGGMGDVLSGLVGGLVAQGHALPEALRLAVCVHGESADLAAEALGQRGLLATDLYPLIRQLLNPRQ